MNPSSQPQTSLTTFLSFLNSHSSESFTDKDLRWLFQIPQLADVFHRVVHAALEGNDCILGVDELDVYFDLIVQTNCRYESLSGGYCDGKRRPRSEDAIRYVNNR